MTYIDFPPDILQGYLYDHQAHKATWLRDSWRFAYATSTWEKIRYKNEPPIERYGWDNDDDLMVMINYDQWSMIMW